MSNSTEPVSNIWHDRSELPDSNKTVLIIEKASYIGNPGTPHLSKYDTRNKCYIAVEETDIDNHPQIYNITHIEKWAYVDYLLGLSNSVAKTSEQKEPKFKIGQTITGPEDKTFTFHINKIEDGKYIESDDVWVLIKDADEEYQLVEANKMCLYSKDDFTEEDRNVLCEGCEEECKYSKQSVDEAMAEIEEKAKAFTKAHKGESADEILSEMRGEEPVSEELEEAAIENARFERGDDTEVSYDINRYEGFIDGSNWQKENDAKIIFNAKEEGYRLGKATMKQQMMKDAVDGEIGEYYPITIHLNKDIPELKHFDKVKLIIIKED